MKKIIQILITFVLCLAILKLSCVGLRDTLNDYFVPETSYVFAVEPESPVSPSGTPEYITGPLASDVGELCVFKLNNEARADWVVVRQIDKDSPPQFYIDTSGSALAFSSSIAAKYTIIASIIEEGQPKILQHVCDYGITPDPKPDPTPMPKPEPEPEPKTLSEWIRQNIPEAGKSQTAILASCYKSAAEGIEKGSIKTSEAAFSVVRTNTQTKIKLDVWQKFLDELSVKITEKLAGTTDVKKLGEVFNEIANGLNPVSAPEIPKKTETVTVVPPQRTPAPQVRVVTPARQADCATGTCPAPQPRFFRSR